MRTGCIYIRRHTCIYTYISTCTYAIPGLAVQMDCGRKRYSVTVDVSSDTNGLADSDPAQDLRFAFVVVPVPMCLSWSLRASKDARPSVRLCIGLSGGGVDLMGFMDGVCVRACVRDVCGMYTYTHIATECTYICT